MSLPLIPFAKLPYKQWKDNDTEKKPRLSHVQHENKIFRISVVEDDNSTNTRVKDRKGATAREKRLLARRRKKGAYLDSDSEDSNDNDSNASSDESSEYDLLDHIKDLLPDEVTKPGEVPKKKANTLHLEELRAKKKKRNYFALFQRISKSVEDFKARERERRKHHLLRHFEEKVVQYDLEQKKRLEELLEQRKKEDLLEEYHRQQRIERNSRKKVEKKLLADQFSTDLDRREHEDRQMLYYSEYFSQWRIEEMDKLEKAEQLEKEKVEKDRKEKKEFDEKEMRRLLIESDSRLVAEDEQLTRQVESIMLRSGMIHYQPKLITDDKEMVNQVFKRNKSFKQRQQSMKDEKDATMRQWRELEEERERQLLAAAAADNTTGTTAPSTASTVLVTSMELVLDEHSRTPEELQDLYKELKKSKSKRNARIFGYYCPFKLNLAEISSTSDITHIRGRNWKEIGLFAFCYEMTQNSHFLMMTHLDISFCYIRNVGLQHLLYHLKINNLFAIQSLNLTANYLTKQITTSFIEISRLNLFQNLRKLNLSKNELRDEGIQELIIPLIVNKYVMNLEELILCQNSITNLGFEGIMKILIPLQDPCIPNIQRIALEKNLIDGPCRRQFFPIPSFVSL